MDRTVIVLGAPSSIGIRPYDDGDARRLDLAPRVLREHGLIERVRARDAGDVLPPPYRDFVRPPGRPRNEDGMIAYARALGDRIAAFSDREFVVLLGGDCSIVLGGLLGVGQRAGGRVGLAYVDAHADFATPEVSRTGSVASMCLGLAVGRGATPLARLRGADPLVRLDDVVVIGRRDEADEPYYGQDVLRSSPILDLPHVALRSRVTAATAQAALDRLTRPGVRGFWIHVDADVLDPSELPAVDSPEPGGLSFDELAEIVTPLARHPAALGLELTIYDPTLDPDASGARGLVRLLERVLGDLADSG
jgi:arginase